MPIPVNKALINLGFVRVIIIKLDPVFVLKKSVDYVP